jgi:hypothetical protein
MKKPKFRIKAFFVSYSEFYLSEIIDKGRGGGGRTNGFLFVKNTLPFETGKGNVDHPPSSATVH